MKRAIDWVHYNYKLFILLVTIFLVLGVLLLSGLNDTGKVSASTSNQKYFVCVEIGEGDTLWSIADLYFSEEYSTVEEYIKEIKELNDLSSDKIYSGATLVVPYFAP